jgi:hypothetical protein
MRAEPHAAVEAAIEQRLQHFVRDHHPGTSLQLEITQRMTLHDDVEPWAIYETGFRLTPVPALAATDAADSEAAANIIAFPQDRCASRHSAAITAAEMRSARRPSCRSV